MEEKMFINLATNEMLTKIDIDPRLIPSFKRVMEKLQAFLNSNNYSSQINYDEIIQSFLINNQDDVINNYRNSIEYIEFKKEKLEATNEMSKILGYEIAQRSDEELLRDFLKQKGIIPKLKIVIKQQMATNGKYDPHVNILYLNENYLERNQTSIDSTLCHEFIHFLTMCGAEKYNSVLNTYKPFHLEALTEMMTQEMYPETSAYEIWIRLVKYVNNLYGIDDYKSFLNRQLDPKHAEDCELFFHNANTYFMAKPEHRNCDIGMVINDPEFIDLQREAIRSIILNINFNDTDSYVNITTKIQKVPFMDEDFMNKLMDIMDDRFIKNMQLPDGQSIKAVKIQLSELRKMNVDIAKQDSSSANYEEQLNYQDDLVGRIKR